jgi:hypothetical protein
MNHTPPTLEADADLETTCAVLGVSPDDVIAEFERRQAVKVAQMRTRMALAAKAGGTRRILRDRGDGGGFVDMMMDPVSYHYWGRRLGYECWDDPQFRREYKRDNPAARVRTQSNRLVITRPEPLPVTATAAPHLAPNRPTPPLRSGRRGRWGL